MEIPLKLGCCPEMGGQWDCSPVGSAVGGSVADRCCGRSGCDGGSKEFPSSLSYSVDKQIDKATDWMVAHWRPTTISFRDVVLDVMLPIEDFLLWIPWWLFIAVVSLLGWRINGLNWPCSLRAGSSF